MSVLYYTQSVPVAGSSGSVAAATATATLTGRPGMATYITGFTVSGGGSTAGGTVNVTVTGVIGGTMTFSLGIPALVTSPVLLNQIFPLPIPTTTQNTNIVVSVPTFGAGNTGASIVAYGYLK